MQKKGNVIVEGEDLNVLIGSKPLKDEEKEAVKKQLLQLLDEEYGIEEEDFLSAEIEVVPAGKARDFGLDRSMIMSYGQDDRVCAYTSLAAMLNVEAPKRTSCCILVDKEEIGSVGATGMHSKFFENTVAEILALTGRCILGLHHWILIFLHAIIRRKRSLRSKLSKCYGEEKLCIFRKGLSIKQIHRSQRKIRIQFFKNASYPFSTS